MRRARAIAGGVVLASAAVVFLGAGLVIGVAIGSWERREDRRRRRCQ